MNEGGYKEQPKNNESKIVYNVRLFHARDPNIPCRNDGKADSFEVTAKNKADLRTKVESGDSACFKGDTCKKCGALAKVWVEEKR